MEKEKKKAWIYMSVDAPEDSHGALKRQYERLYAYGEGISVEVAGCSGDTGSGTGLGRPGLEQFLAEKDKRGIGVLLLMDSGRISRDRMMRNEFLLRMESCGIVVCSPLEGILSASPLNAGTVQYVDHAIIKDFGLAGVMERDDIPAAEKKEAEDKR